MADQPLIDISPENWRIVRDILQRHVPDREVWAFGSRAKWTAKEYSDLDIAVIGDEPLSIGVMAELNEAFQESALPFKVDVVDSAGITPSFRKVIDAHHVLLKQAKILVKWHETSLADISADISYGFTESAVSEPVGPHFLRITDIQGGYFDWKSVPYCRIEADKKPKYQLKVGDIVVARTGNSTGENAIILDNEDAVFASYLIRFRLNQEKVVPDFIWYQMRSAAWWGFVNAIKGGSAQPGANAKQLGSFPIRFPHDLAEQQEISGVLRALDDKICLLRETNVTLEAIAQALFKSWFVDFDPVRAKAEGREPEGVPPEIAELFPSEFEDSDLGQIPRGWSVGSFGDYAVLSKGNLNPQQSPSVEYRHYSIPAFDNGQMPAIEYGADIMSNKTIVPNGSVLQSKLNPHTPRIWLLGDVPQNAVCSTEFLPWIPSEISSKELIYCILKSTKFEQAVMTLVTGTSNSHQRVKAEQISRLTLIVANSKINQVFADMVEPLFSRVAANRQMAYELGKLRDELLPNLVSGSLQLPESVEA